MRAKRFTAGLLTGAVIGGVVGMIIDPIKDKDCKKLRHGAGSILHTVGNIVDGLADMKE